MHLEGEPVSSTRIRRLIQQGSVEHAARLLGRPHTLEGYVVAGAGRGRDLGTPTANLEVPAHVAVPAHGVYVTLTDLGRGAREPGVTSVGTNPTFETDGVTRVEHTCSGSPVTSTRSKCGWPSWPACADRSSSPTRPG